MLLLLNQNRVSGKSIDVTGFYSSWQSIQRLKLRENGISNEMAKHITVALQENQV